MPTATTLSRQSASLVFAYDLKGPVVYLHHIFPITTFVSLDDHDTKKRMSMWPHVAACGRMRIALPRKMEVPQQAVGNGSVMGGS
jgi:hypothetical protein